MQVNTRFGWGLGVGSLVALFFGWASQGSLGVRFVWTLVALISNGSAAWLVAHYWHWFTRGEPQTNVGFDGFWLEYFVSGIPTLIFFWMADSRLTSLGGQALWEVTRLWCSWTLFIALTFLYFRVVHHRPTKRERG